MGVGGQYHALAPLPPRKTWYPLYRRLGGPQGQSGRVWKISPLPGFYHGPCSPQRVAILNVLSRHKILVLQQFKNYPKNASKYEKLYREQIWGFHSADVEDSGLLRCYNASPYQLLKRKLLQPFQMSGYIKVPAAQSDIHPIPKTRILNNFKSKSCVINKQQQ